jgi:hypothetical protein
MKSPSQLLRLLRLLPLPLALVLSGAVSAEVPTEEYRVEDGSRVIRQEIVVNAALEDVWRAFTAKEGWESWAVPFAHVELAAGGLIETSYDASPMREGQHSRRFAAALPAFRSAIERMARVRTSRQSWEAVETLPRGSAHRRR